MKLEIHVQTHAHATHTSTAEILIPEDRCIPQNKQNLLWKSSMGHFSNMPTPPPPHLFKEVIFLGLSVLCQAAASYILQFVAALSDNLTTVTGCSYYPLYEGSMLKASYEFLSQWII